MSSVRNVGDWIANRYEIYQVHQGGMGIVYVVYDHEGAAGQRVLAIKTLRDELLSDRRQVARFTAECQIWIQLERHPYLVRAYSIQQLDGKPHVLMELVTGGSLRTWIGTPRLDLPRALHFGIEFCMGMEYAVQKGLRCHRDIKPENLMITDSGTLKITDFGVAKVIDETIDNSYNGAIPLAQYSIDWSHTPSHAHLSATETVYRGPSEEERRTVAENANGDLPPNFKVSEMPTISMSGDQQALELTVAGTLLGTGPYMAPEQFHDARASTIQADIYSFGIVLFEMLAGILPFQGRTLAKLARQHARDEPPSIIPFIPKRHGHGARAVDRILQQCLAKDRTKRFASLAELRYALSRCLWRVAREKVNLPNEAELEAWELTNKGVSLGTLGRYDEERACYERSLQNKPDYVPAWFNLAAVSGASGHPNEAIDYADVALHLNPSSVPALLNKGLALYALKRADKAIACFDLAVHLQPRSPEVWYGRALILLLCDNFDGAKAALEQALRLHPEFPAAIQAIGAAHSHVRPTTIAWVRRTEDAGPEARPR